MSLTGSNANIPPKPGDVTYFAESDYRNRNTKFGIKREDRTRHTYVIGKTGMGKTTLLENMAIQDIRNGNGLAFIDPHGEVADSLLDYVPEDRVKDVMYFAPFDLDHPISFNVMEDVGADKRHLVADGLLSAFKKIWVDMWSGRMEYLLNNALLALLEYPDATLLGVNRMFADKAYRERVVANVTDVSVKAFWEDEFANYDQQFAAQAASAIQNKVGQFVSNPQVRNIVGQVNSSFDVRKMMDEKKIMLINLSKGQVGEDNARLIGSMLITKMYLAAMSRADTGGSEGNLANLPQFYFYVDEFQSFANESFAGILSEARKYKLNLTIAHQYIEQMDEDVRNAVFGNVGTMISFRVGAFDAEVLEKEFAPTFEAEDLVNLGFAQIYLKLMIDGVSSKPFSARTLPPIESRGKSYRDEVRAHSREAYGRPRSQVEAEVAKWHKSTYGIIDDEQALAMAEKQRAQREAEGKEPLEEPTPPKRELVKKYEIGQVVEGTVANVVDFGIFVRIEKGLEGLAHISELTDDHVNDPNDLYSEDDEVTAKVIDIDDDKISLSIKALESKEESQKSKAKSSDNDKVSSEVEESESDTKSRAAGEQSDEVPSANEKKKKKDKGKKKKNKKDSKAKSSDSDEEAGKKGKTASLKDLGKEKQDDKAPTQANKSKLKQALSKAMGEKESKANEQSDEVPSESSRSNSKPTDKNPSSDELATHEAIEELSEEDLRQMLKVEEDKDAN